ncbi:MAG: hypothetical protein J7501_14510, partial [Bdellovibrio sp.]|nr:hypothetical protein [Bdellovibrio sp.]
YHQSGRILVKKEIWDAFSPRSKVALAMHEMAYKEARDQGRPASSYYVRRFVGLMFSNTDVPSVVTEIPKYQVNYFCTNSDMQLGANIIYRVLVGGNRCVDSAKTFCDGQIKFLSLNGQVAYDNATLDFRVGAGLLEGLTQSQGNVISSSSGAIQSKVFEGVSLYYTVIMKNGVPTPLLKTSQPDSKAFVELTCTKQ